MLRLAPILFVWLALDLRAQAQEVAPRHATVLDLTGAAGPSLGYASAAAWRLWGLDQAGRLQAGLGVRGSYFFANQNEFDSQTGTAGTQLRVQEPRLVALNAAFHLRARLAGPVRVGFNLDFAGVTLGPDRTAQLTSGVAPASVAPVRGNLLRGGSPDIGSLNSELYLSLVVSQGLSVRGGLSHIVTAYAVGNDRYRRFWNLAALGVSYQLP